MEGLCIENARPERRRRKGRCKKRHTFDHPPLLSDPIIFFVLYFFNVQIFPISQSSCLFLWSKSYISSLCNTSIFDGLVLTSKIAKKSFNEAKKRVPNTTPKKFPRSNKKGYIIRKIQISKFKCKIKVILSGSVTQS